MPEVVLGIDDSTIMAATTLSSSLEDASGPLAPAVGSRVMRNTELGHRGARGGRRQRGRRAQGCDSKLVGDGIELKGGGGTQSCWHDLVGGDSVKLKD
jgi:hypothetical protein